MQELGDILFLLEADLVVALQRRRSDLFFLHCAALEWEGRAYLFAGDSGAGKSTTAWALLHHGFGYLSDELAPVDLESLVVLPFPRALCLKSALAAPYALPPDAIQLGHRIHTPCASLPAPVIDRPLPIGAIFLLAPRSRSAPPSLRTLAPAEAAARLYVVALNALAHSGRGLDAAVQIAQRVPCHALTAGALPATCDLILRQVLPRQSC